MISYRNAAKFFPLLFLMLILWESCSRDSLSKPLVQVSFVSNINNQPRFSWQMDGVSDGFNPSTSRILVAGNEKDLITEKNLIWDSGMKENMNPLGTICPEKGFKNGDTYFARLLIRDKKGKASQWSDIISFTIPLNYPRDWQAKWIGYDYHPDSALPVFKKVFKGNNLSDVQSARLYISAPGFYEACLNGTKIGDNVLDPGQTNYEDYAYYSVYEIDRKELKKDNVLTILLGNGWYNQNQVWRGQAESSPMVYGPPVFIAQLIVKYKSGETEVTGSDESWKWTSGPIVYSNIYGGETYDANREIDLLSSNTDAPLWKESVTAKVYPPRIFEQFADPLRKMGVVEVRDVLDVGDGKYIFDMGENFAGWLQLKISAEKGREIQMRFAEELDENQQLNPATTGVRATKVVQTDKYICNGEGTEIWEPRFTYHGFRYAEITGLKEKPAKDLVTGYRVYSSVPETGYFVCSEENINKLHELAVRTITSNIHSIPTDCPHRERCGWTGDAHALATSLFANFYAKDFLTKYMFDMRSSAREEKTELYFAESFHHRSMRTKPSGIPTMIVPGKRTSGIASPDWGTAMVQVPWYLYLYYGDQSILEEFYPDMKAWVQYIHDLNVDGIIPHGLGDWCPPYSWEDRCPVPLSSSAFHILDVKIMKQIAGVLGLNREEELYSEWMDYLVRQFNTRFFDPLTADYGTQTANALVLDIGIAPVKNGSAIAQRIVEDSYSKYHGFLNTGIFGIGRIFKALCDNGQEQEAFRLLTKTGENSFAYMWDHWDATTLWETLPVFNPDSGRIRHSYFFSSHSHPMQSGFDAWFYSDIAGIHPSASYPGFKRIIFKPRLTQYMEWAKAEYNSGFGKIISSWKNEKENLIWDISVPPGSEGEIFIPVSNKETLLSVNEEEILLPETKDKFASIGIFAPGNYHLVIQKK